jgi:hypothetical protein
MNLKQRTFFFVALSVTGLLVMYLGFSNYYVHQQEKQFLDGRLESTRTVAREFDEFFTRGVTRLDMISQLPGLAYGLHTLEADREGKQIPAWTTLHYLSYQSDVFTNGIFHSLNGEPGCQPAGNPVRTLRQFSTPEGLPKR